MPYSIETEDGITVDGIPDNIAPDAPELRQRVASVRLQRRRESPEYKADAEASRAAERDRLMRQNVADMSLPERWAANWSAGYGNLAQGIDQLLGKVGIGRGVSDEDIREKRERDRYLREGTPGGASLQLQSEVLPSLAMPAGMFARPIAAAARVAPLGPTSQLLGASAAGGAANAALSPVTSEESRGANAAIAAGIGAAIPGAGAAVPAAVRGGRKLLTESGAQQRAVDYLADHLGDASPRVLELLGARKSPTLRGAPVEVPTSAAQATGDAHLAQLEAYSRSKPSTQPDWADFDAGQNAQRYEVLQRMTPSETRLARQDAVRAGRTAPMYKEALDEAAQRGGYVEPVLTYIDDALSSAASANPSVRSMLAYAKRELSDEVVSPKRLQVIRQTLASKVHGPVAIGDELGSAAKGAKAETLGLIGTIDDALDAAANGKWKPAQREFAERSKPVTSGRALRDALEKIEQKPLRGTTPEVTAAGYSSAMRQATQSKYGDKLTPEARSDADAFQEHLRQAEAASRTRKTAATMGGGSITNTDTLLAAAVTKAIHAIPGVGGYATRIGDMNREAFERELAKLLQSPTSWVRCCAHCPSASVPRCLMRHYAQVAWPGRLRWRDESCAAGRRPDARCRRGEAAAARIAHCSGQGSRAPGSGTQGRRRAPAGRTRSG
ncbi:MAG: hypothetical protein QM722_15040 [Piscinibacter sp.]